MVADGSLAELVVSSLSPIVAVVIGWWLSRKVNAVHAQVNSNFSAVTNKLALEVERTAQLETSMRNANVPIPPKLGSM